MQKIRDLIDKLDDLQALEKEEWMALIDGQSPKTAAYLYEKAAKKRDLYYGHEIYIRGLIEFTNYCKNNCYYCGIRRDNKNAHRYRLTKESILACAQEGYALGFRTFVLQGGEDPYFTDQRVVSLVSALKEKYPDCALTLSIGEKARESYQAYFDAGADRYLLRHETACPAHYRKLHPAELSLENRKRCLWDLREIGYQVGAGFMVGSPYQTTENLAEDMLFLKELNPHMVGIGPFIAHHDTPFAAQKNGTLDQTLYMLGLLRLSLPKVLLPATTALGTIHPKGRELGIMAGANVIMPNLSPENVRKDYLLYDHKLCTGSEAAQNVDQLRERMKAIGFDFSLSRGDSLVERG